MIRMIDLNIDIILYLTWLMLIDNEVYMTYAVYVIHETCINDNADSTTLTQVRWGSHVTSVLGHPDEFIRIKQNILQPYLYRTKSKVKLKKKHKHKVHIKDHLGWIFGFICKYIQLYTITTRLIRAMRPVYRSVLKHIQVHTDNNISVISILSCIIWVPVQTVYMYSCTLCIV